jgi:outer membrane protein assembly factor BamB
MRRSVIVGAARRRFGRYLSCVGLAAGLVAGLGACSASPPPSLAADTAACQQAAAPRLPAASANARPGAIRWAVSVARCADDAGQDWPESMTEPVIWAQSAPGNRLVVLVDGVVSMYDANTGARLWQRHVAPAGRAAFTGVLRASRSLVLVQYSVAGTQNTVSTFLNADTGQPFGNTNVAVPGDPILVGSRVVLTEVGALEGYDPATGRTPWKTDVPAAPVADHEVDDGTVVYLNSAATSGSTTPQMRDVDRLDPATGRLLAPIGLPQPLGFDVSTQGAQSGYAQGLLVLPVTPPCGGTADCGQPDRTVAVDTATETVMWSHPGFVEAEPAGLFAGSDGSTGVTAVDPRTGKDSWTVRLDGYGTVAGPRPELLRSGYLAEWTTVGNGSAVVGLDPRTQRQLWTSPTFGSSVVYVTSGSAAVYALTCDSPSPAHPHLCSSITLTAVAA